MGFIPEELVYGAGFLPVGLWGGSVEIEMAKRYYPSFFCAPVQETLELFMRGRYDGILRAVMMPVYCDALRSAGQNLKAAVPSMEMIPVVYPANRERPSGIRFLASEYRKAAERLEKLSGKNIGEAELEKAVQVYNRFRSSLREWLTEAERRPKAVTPLLRHQVIKASFCMDKEKYTGQIRELTACLRKMPAENRRGKRVILTGIMLDNEEILRELEELGIDVAGDYLIQESLQIQTDVPQRKEDEGVLYRLACRFGTLKFCSAAMDCKKERIERLCQAAKERDAGVIVCAPSFCDPEEYDYPLIRKKLEENGVPSLYLEFQTSQSASRAKTLLQTFGELLESRTGKHRFNDRTYQI